MSDLPDDAGLPVPPVPTDAPGQTSAPGQTGALGATDGPGPAGSPSLPRAHAVLRKEGPGAEDTVSLDYEGRFLRRKRLVSDAGRAFLVDLAEVTSLDEGDALALSDGTRVAVRAAPEPLLSVTGGALARLAWHIGNRHTPCRIEADRLLIRNDHVLADMLRRLGAKVAPLSGPFQPEGGAYGHGRTLGHAHTEAEVGTPLHAPHHSHDRNGHGHG